MLGRAAHYEGDYKPGQHEWPALISMLEARGEIHNLCIILFINCKYKCASYGRVWYGSCSFTTILHVGTKLSDRKSKKIPAKRCHPNSVLVSY